MPKIKEKKIYRRLVCSGRSGLKKQKRNETTSTLTLRTRRYRCTRTSQNDTEMTTLSLIPVVFYDSGGCFVVVCFRANFICKRLEEMDDGVGGQERWVDVTYSKCHRWRKFDCWPKSASNRSEGCLHSGCSIYMYRQHYAPRRRSRPWS